MAVLGAISHRSLGPRRGARGQPADRQEGEADADGGDSDKPGNAPELTLERSPFAVLTLSVSAAIRPGSVCLARRLRAAPTAECPSERAAVARCRLPRESSRRRRPLPAPRRRRAGPRRRGGRRAELRVLCRCIWPSFELWSSSTHSPRSRARRVLSVVPNVCGVASASRCPNPSRCRSPRRRRHPPEWLLRRTYVTQSP